MVYIKVKIDFIMKILYLFISEFAKVFKLKLRNYVHGDNL
jgi:hypothetical protein